jgi:hypothetical protein
MGAQRSLWGSISEILLQVSVTSGSVEVGDEGHDDGSDSRVKAAVVTRCLSPLGTGNDETGSDWLSGGDDACWNELLVGHRMPSLVGNR